MSEKLQDMTVEELKKDLSNLRRDLVSLGDDVKAVLEAKAALVGKKGNEAGQEAWDELQHAFKMARKRGEKAMDDTTMKIEDNPWSSIAIAAGVGLLVGLLVKRGDK